MNYIALLAVPLAAAALSASSADALRVPTGWQAGASFTWPAARTYLAGVAPEPDAAAPRALTVRSQGKRKPTELGAVWQSVSGYAGKRVRFTAQVKAEGLDTWAGLVVREGFLPLHLLPGDPAEPLPGADAGAPACADWCTANVVADIPAEGFGAVTVGLALLGNGQVWARGFQLEVVGPDTPVTAQRFAAEQTAALRASVASQREAKAEQPAPPLNLGLQ